MSEINTLVAHFPRAAMGYAASAVDEFVRQIGVRLEEMQARVDELTERNSQLEGQAVVTQKERDTDGQREVALANAMLAIEQRKMAVDQEIESLVSKARQESDLLKEAARREAENVKEAGRREAEGLRTSAQAESNEVLNRAKLAADQILEDASAAASAEEQRVVTLSQKYDKTVAEIRRVLEQQLALLPDGRSFDFPDVATTRPQPATGQNFGELETDPECATAVAAAA